MRGGLAIPLAIASLLGVGACSDTASSTEPSDAVLQLDDLPEGFVVAPEDPDVSGDFCGTDPTDEVPEEEEVTASFSQGDFGPFVTNAVAEYSDEATAMAFMNAVRPALEECNGYEDDINGSVKDLAFPDLGDDTFSARYSVDSVVGPVVADIVYVRAGRLVALVAHSGITAVDTDLTEELSRLVADRL